MAAVSGISTISKIFSKLGDNTGSLVPMYAKDFTADTFTSYTYYKEGGNRDASEKALEEFGTGVLWLGAIPFLKFLFDKTISKKAGVNPDVDATRLFSGNNANNPATLEFAKNKAAELGNAFSEQKDILDKTIKNKNLAKNISLAKFGISTAIAGAALFGLITLKQKRTEKAIEKQIREKNQNAKTEKNALNFALKDNKVYKNFTGKSSDASAKDVPFTGLGTFFMTNPIANTTIIDGVITGTRLVQARKGEHFEVGFNEFCELLFAYGLIKPMQASFEFIGEKILKRPIQLDYSALDLDAITQAAAQEKVQKGSSKLLSDAKYIVNTAKTKTPVPNEKLPKFLNNVINKVKGTGKKLTDESAKNIIDFVFDNQESGLADIFKRNGDISTFKTSGGVEQLSLLSGINGEKLVKTSKDTVKLIEKAAASGTDPAKYLKTTKLVKGGAIIANILASALIIGCVKPKINLWLRKKLHNGDNTNPAIRHLETEIERKLAFEGNNENNA